jgi:type VI secretion system protein ImpH
MPPAQRQHGLAVNSVIERLFERPEQFSVFQAVRWLERWMAREEGVGGKEVLSKRIAFRNSLSLAFPPSEMAEFKLLRATEAEGAAATASDTEVNAIPTHSRQVAQVQITPAFMGLLGAGGALPNFYTELLAQREQATRDDAPRAFLDLFQHRAMVLAYQAWRKHRLHVQFESDRRNRFLPLVLALAGVGQGALRDRMGAAQGGVADDAAAFYAGALQRRTVSAVTLRQVVSHYFEVPVQLDEFVGRWFELPVENQSRLGLANGTLGGGAVMGERVWQRDLRLRLTLGPMPLKKYSRFLPGSPGERALKELLTLMTGVSLEYEVRLRLRAEDVRSTTLGTGLGGRLGWDSYLVTQAQTQDRQDAGYGVHMLH